MNTLTRRLNKMRDGGFLVRRRYRSTVQVLAVRLSEGQVCFVLAGGYNARDGMAWDGHLVSTRGGNRAAMAGSREDNCTTGPGPLRCPGFPNA